MMEFNAGFKQAIFLVICTVFLVKSAWAVQCYECNTKLKGDCWDPSKLEPFKKDCGNGTAICRKIYQTVKGEVRVVRQCSNVEAPPYCILRAGTKEVKIQYCHCQGDFCNAAPSFLQPTSILITSTMIIFAYLSSRSS